MQESLTFWVKSVTIAEVLKNNNADVAKDLNGTLYIASYSDNLLKRAKTKDVNHKSGESFKFDSGISEDFLKIMI